MGQLKSHKQSGLDVSKPGRSTPKKQLHFEAFDKLVKPLDLLPIIIEYFPVCVKHITFFELRLC